jgi:hypothetical protein
MTVTFQNRKQAALAISRRHFRPAIQDFCLLASEAGGYFGAAGFKRISLNLKSESELTNQHYH